MISVGNETGSQSNIADGVRGPYADIAAGSQDSVTFRKEQCWLLEVLKDVIGKTDVDRRVRNGPAGTRAFD